MAASTNRSRSARLVTSACTTSASPPASRSRRSAAASRWGSRPQTATRDPSSASRSASAAPSPSVPPVINTTFPVRCKSIEPFWPMRVRGMRWTIPHRRDLHGPPPLRVAAEASRGRRVGRRARGGHDGPDRHRRRRDARLRRTVSIASEISRRGACFTAHTLGREPGFHPRLPGHDHGRPRVLLRAQAERDPDFLGPRRPRTPSPLASATVHPNLQSAYPAAIVHRGQRADGRDRGRLQRPERGLRPGHLPVGGGPASVQPGCFTKVNQNGAASPLPSAPAPPDWDRRGVARH